MESASGAAKSVSIGKTQLDSSMEKKGLKMESKQRDPEDEAFEELGKTLMWRKRQISAANGPESAFQEWSGRSHTPQQADVERSAFFAGWRAAKEQQ